MRKIKLALLVTLILSLALFLSGCGPSKPSASFTADPESGEAPLAVSFDASNSSDPDGNIISYDWDFGNEEHGSGEEVDHVYSSSGDYAVTLTVTDNDGATDTKTETISVSVSSNGEKRVEILDWQRTEEDDGDILITGTAENISNKILAAAVVEGKLFNAEDERVGTAMAAITFLYPGEEWAFEADSITSNDEVDYVEMVTDSSVYESP